mgnify:CR=1 FL=1
MPPWLCSRRRSPSRAGPWRWAWPHPSCWPWAWPGSCGHCRRWRRCRKRPLSPVKQQAHPLMQRRWLNPYRRPSCRNWNPHPALSPKPIRNPPARPPLNRCNRPRCERSRRQWAPLHLHLHLHLRLLTATATACLPGRRMHIPHPLLLRLLRHRHPRQRPPWRHLHPRAWLHRNPPRSRPWHSPRKLMPPRTWQRSGILPVTAPVPPQLASKPQHAPR